MVVAANGWPRRAKKALGLRAAVDEVGEQPWVVSGGRRDVVGRGGGWWREQEEVVCELVLRFSNFTDAAGPVD